jgi:hypothetical protein
MLAASMPRPAFLNKAFEKIAVLYKESFCGR